MGATDTHLQHLAYIGPDEALHAAASSDLTEALTDLKPAVILLDGVNAAMTLNNLELESNGDATKFSQLLLKPMSRTGACVITVDHVPKNSEQRGKGGIGAQAKRAMMTGCTLRVEILEEFGRGMTGRLKLTVDKDRPGHVRAVSADAKHAGTFIIASDKEGSITARIDAPDMRPQNDIKKERDDARFSTLMEACSRELENARASGVDDGEMTQRALEVAVALRIEGGVRADDVREAARRLVSVSCAAVRPGGRNALLYRSTKPYRRRPEGLDDAFRGLL